MNRREFLFRTSAATAALVAAPAIALTPTPPLPPVDPFEILSPDEIRAWLGNNRYVSTPCFRYFHHPAVIQGKNGLELDSGTPYYVRTWKLKLRVSADYAISVARHGDAARQLSKRMAITEITRLGLTHIHSVRFCEIACVSVPDGYPQFHSAYVRGAKVNL